MRPSGTSERRRVSFCAVVGAAIGSATALASAWQLAVLVGWIVTATILVVWVWVEIAGLDAAATAQVATREDDSRSAARAVLLASSVLSLAAIVAALHRASSAEFWLDVALISASLVAVVVSWLVVNTAFVLRYAHLYYGVGGVGGVEFSGGAAPDYRDFAYLAFTVGMTFQVSDTTITERPVRTTVLLHGLLSYVFSIAIISMTINVIAGLVR